MGTSGAGSGDTGTADGSRVAGRNSAAQVAVLLCTYNGGPYLDEQLDSIARQTHPAIGIWVSDDGSTDGTLERLREWQLRWDMGPFEIVAGPRQGFVANFLSLLGNSSIQADYFAFADQDDVWEADRVARAVDWLAAQPADQPSLYGSRTRLIDGEGHPYGLSTCFTRQPSFRNALVQSLAGANTMLMNRAARDLLVAVSAGQSIVSHDWWSYLVITAAGGVAHYDPYPGLRYRQHRGNLAGSNLGLRAKLWRIRRLFAGHFKAWNERNLRALRQHEGRWTPEARRTLALFDRARRAWLPRRLWLLHRAGVYRQTWEGNLGLVVAAILGRL